MVDNPPPVGAVLTVKQMRPNGAQSLLFLRERTGVDWNRLCASSNDKVSIFAVKNCHAAGFVEKRRVSQRIL